MVFQTLTLIGALMISPTTYAGPAHPSFVAATEDQTAWLLSYEGKSTNEVRWDPKLPELLQAGLPNIHVDFYDRQKTLPENALVALSGPPEIVTVESHRYVVLAASVPQVGELKGLLWVDTGTSQPSMIFAALNQNPAATKEASLALFTCSKELAATLPPQFISALHGWLSKKGIKRVTQFTMQDSAGTISHLPLGILDIH